MKNIHINILRSCIYYISYFYLSSIYFYHGLNTTAHRKRLQCDQYGEACTTSIAYVCCQLSVKRVQSISERPTTLPTSCLRSNRLINTVTLATVCHGNGADNLCARNISHRSETRAYELDVTRRFRGPLPTPCSPCFVHSQLSTYTNTITARDSVNRVHVI